MKLADLTIEELQRKSASLTEAVAEASRRTAALRESSLLSVGAPTREALYDLIAASAEWTELMYHAQIIEAEMNSRTPLRELAERVQGIATIRNSRSTYPVPPSGDLDF